MHSECTRFIKNQLNTGSHFESTHTQQYINTRQGSSGSGLGTVSGFSFWKCNEHLGSIKCSKWLTSCGTISFPWTQGHGIHSYHGNEAWNQYFPNALFCYGLSDVYYTGKLVLALAIVDLWITKLALSLHSTYLQLWRFPFQPLIYCYTGSLQWWKQQPTSWICWKEKFTTVQFKNRKVTWRLKTWIYKNTRKLKKKIN